jgi:hypothetical protein
MFPFIDAPVPTLPLRAANPTAAALEDFAVQQAIDRQRGISRYGPRIVTMRPAGQPSNDAQVWAFDPATLPESDSEAAWWWLQDYAHGSTQQFFIGSAGLPYEPENDAQRAGAASLLVGEAGFSILAVKRVATARMEIPAAREFRLDLSGNSRPGYAMQAPYEGVREASEIMRAEGVPRKIRKQVLESFDREAMRVRTAGTQDFGLRFFDNLEAKPLGRNLFETFPASRGSLALKTEWNQMNGIKQWRIREGSIIFEGPAAPQGPGLAGGQTQKYVLHLEDLLEPTE